MDKREAIEILEYERDTDFFVSDYRNRVHEALDLAIEALQEPTRDELGDCTLCRYVGSTICDECINGSLWARGDAESATTTDCISRQQAIGAIEGVDWYHVNSKGELVCGSTSDEESWYKAEDIYKAIESLQPVTPTVNTDDVEHIARLIKDAFRSGFKEGKRLMRKVREGENE